jgi:hypothetical protein
MARFRGSYCLFSSVASTSFLARDAACRRSAASSSGLIPSRIDGEAASSERRNTHGSLEDAAEDEAGGGGAGCAGAHAAMGRVRRAAEPQHCWPSGMEKFTLWDDRATGINPFVPVHKPSGMGGLALLVLRVPLVSFALGLFWLVSELTHLVRVACPGV